jgi:hypothetical protein
MKVVNQLDGNEVEIDSIMAIYTGPLQELSNDAPQAPDSFERSVPERIMPQDLVLHELNLLQVGFTCWIKIDTAPGKGVVWVPARVDP